jgi:hypothetical protein
MVTIAGVTASGVYDYFGFSGDGNIAVLGTMLDTAMLCRNLLISGASVRG